MDSFIPKYNFIYEDVEGIVDKIDNVIEDNIDINNIMNDIIYDKNYIENVISETVEDALKNVIENNIVVTSEDLLKTFNEGGELLKDDKFLEIAREINNYTYTDSFRMFIYKYRNKLIELLDKIPSSSKLINTIKPLILDNKFIKYIGQVLFKSKELMLYVIEFIKKFWVSLIFDVDILNGIMSVFMGVSITGIISFISPALAAVYTFTMPILLFIGTITLFISVFISVATYFKESQPGKYIIDIIHNKINKVNEEFTNGILHIYNHIKNDISNLKF